MLDTPGLNAIGTEPELTLGLLPQAHATVFILGAILLLPQRAGVIKLPLAAVSLRATAGVREGTRSVQIGRAHV